MKLQSSVMAGSSGEKTPVKAPIKPEVAIPLYQAIGEEFTSEKQMKKYLSKVKKIKGVRKPSGDSEGITSDTN